MKNFNRHVNTFLLKLSLLTFYVNVSHQNVYEAFWDTASIVSLMWFDVLKN